MYVSLITDFSDGHFYECHSNQWSGPWGWVLLHDLPLTGAWVWRSCRGTVLPGNLCSIFHVHHRISGNSSGKMKIKQRSFVVFVAIELTCIYLKQIKRLRELINWNKADNTMSKIKYIFSISEIHCSCLVDIWRC